MEQESPKSEIASGTVPDRPSTDLHEIRPLLTALEKEVQRIASRQREIQEELLFFNDRIDNLEQCNRQASHVENALDTALQRMRVTEEAIRNLQIINCTTRFEILEATCEHLTIRANRLAFQIAEFERLLSIHRIT